MKHALDEQWRVISPYLDAALTLEAAAREAWLVELALRTPAIAAQVRACLSELAELDEQGFLESAHGISLALPASTGQRVGAYTLERVIGHGGMGTVWRAQRNDGRFEGQVAVKLLNTALIGHPAERRFVREGSVLAQLQHPNIARLLDAGVAATGIAGQGQPYLVLELVEGMRIDHHCDAAQLCVEQRLLLFCQVLAAVAHAHNHLVIHRDIKPSNILVTADGGVKLLDFGIAKLLSDDVDDITVMGYRALTPEYAAPEQLLGGAISTATDVYALGVLLYQLLSGRHPTAPERTPPALAAQAALRDEPLRLSHALAHASSDHGELEQIAASRHTTVPRLRRRLRGDLETIVARALHKQAEQRYPTVAALADDLQRHLTHRPVQARPESWFYRCHKFLRRQRGAVAATSMVIAAVMIGLITTITEARRAERERAKAQQQLTAAESKGELFNYLLWEGFGKSIPVPELLTRAEVVVQQQFGSDPYTNARLNMTLADFYDAAGNSKRAAVLRLQAQNLVRDSADAALSAEIACGVAGQQRTDGDFEQARMLVDAGIARMRGEPRPTDPAVLSWCLLERSWLHLDQADHGQALRDARAALAGLTPPRADQRMIVAIVKIVLGDALGMAGKPKEAIAEYRNTLTELERMGRGKSQTALWVLRNFGALLLRVGEVSEAGRLFERAVRIEDQYGATQPHFVNRIALGRQLIEIGRANESLAVLESARHTASAAGNASHAALAALYLATARCSIDVSSCEAALASARAQMTASLPAGHRHFGALETADAELAFARGDLAAARAALTRARAIHDATGEHSAFSIEALALLARTESQLGAHAAARTHAARAVSQARELMQDLEHSAWLGVALAAQGWVQRAEGATAQARASWQDALVELQTTLGSGAPATREVQQLLAHGAPGA